MAAFTWLEILSAIFVISLFYILWSYVLYGNVKAMIMPKINALDCSGTLNCTQMLNTINVIDMVWQYWPLILIFGLIVYGFVSSMRRDPNELTYY
jgi:hypothetical protein